MYKNRISIKEWAEEDRPREKLLSKGSSSLGNAELLAIILGGGYQNNSAVALARQILLANNNCLNTLARRNVRDLIKFKGVGLVKASTIIAALELGRRKQNADFTKKDRITSSEDAFNFLYPQMADLVHEEFKVLLLNRNNAVLSMETISIGGISGTVVDPKIVFKKALENNSSSIILSHNHPSGNLSPSQADIDITAKLVRAGNNLDIKVLDHIIIAEDKYYSFSDNGRI